MFTVITQRIECLPFVFEVQCQNRSVDLTPSFPSLSDFSMWRWYMMKLRVRKAPQQPSVGHQTHPSQAKRKHCEVEPSPVRGRGKMQKNETGLFSTIKKFIRGNAVKVSTAFFFLFFCFMCFILCFIVRRKNTHSYLKKQTKKLIKGSCVTHVTVSSVFSHRNSRFTIILSLTQITDVHTKVRYFCLRLPKPPIGFSGFVNFFHVV